MKRMAMIGCVCLLGPLSACYNLKAYVDPGLQQIRYADLRQPMKPISIGVLVEFQRSGQELPSMKERANGAVLRVLKDSKLFSTVHSGVATSDRKLEVVINNAGGEIKDNAYNTAATFGLIGTRTTDYYMISVTYQIPGKESIVMEYHHAIHATLGLKLGPPGLESMTFHAAFDKIVEEVILLLLYELQEKGVL